MFDLFRRRRQPKPPHGRRSPPEQHEIVSSFRLAGQDGHPAATSPVSFLHYRTSVFNLGDYLSSPRHYLRFVPRAGGRPVAVIGGGVFGRYERIRGPGEPIDLDNRARVAWGVGLSLKGEDGGGVERLAEMARSFDAVSTRDPDHVSDMVPFCPCSSVLNRIVDIPPGEHTGVLLNFDPRASGRNPLAMLATFRDVVTGVNAVSERDFRRYFARCGRVVTNSYHTAFWGLLSGRAVSIVGFSSKYDSIRSMFNLPVAPRRYAMGDAESLRAAIAAALAENSFVSLDDATAWRERFRDLNRRYADRLVAAGLFERIEPVVDDDDALDCREAEIFAEYVLREW
jgi:hypothetical protein